MNSGNFFYGKQMFLYMFHVKHSVGVNFTFSY